MHQIVSFFEVSWSILVSLLEVYYCGQWWEWKMGTALNVLLLEIRTHQAGTFPLIEYPGQWTWSFGYLLHVMILMREVDVFFSCLVSLTFSFLLLERQWLKQPFAWPADCDQIGGPMSILAFQKALLMDSLAYIAWITYCCKCFLRQPWCLVDCQPWPV